MQDDLDDLDDLSFRFFKLFARFESTLKERGFFRCVGNNTQIVVDWDRFANEIACPFLETPEEEVKIAKEFLCDHPPKKQVCGDKGRVEWATVPSEDKSCQALFGHICRMRNNLFHGAKFNGTWFDPKRSKELLEHGLVILQHLQPWIEE